MPLITTEQVILGLDATDRASATQAMAATLVSDGRLHDLDGFLADVSRREELMATGLPGGIAIPHARSAHAATSSLVFARSETGIDWGAPDGPAHLVFLIAVPEGGGEDQLALLAKLARKLMRPEFKQTLRTATDAAEVVQVIETEVA